jgi:hypothetical protein
MQHCTHCAAVMFIVLKACGAVVSDSDRRLHGPLISITGTDYQYRLTKYCLRFKNTGQSWCCVASPCH